MARRGREVIGTPVYLKESGQRVGIIDDIVLTDSGVVRGFVVTPERGLLRKVYVLNAHLLEEWRPDGAVITSEALQSVRYYDTEGIRLHGDGDGLCGRSLLGGDGRELGAIGDIVLDGSPWKLWGFEVSDGILLDLLDGRPVVEAAGATFKGGCVLLNPKENKHMNLGAGGHPTSES